MVSELSGFETARLRIDALERSLADPLQKAELRTALIETLTPRITRYLPLSMAFSKESDEIDDWIRDRADEAHVLCVQRRDARGFAGLILLHDTPDRASSPTAQLGYFFRDDCWGKGYATEAICALVANLKLRPPVHLVAGVDKPNLASKRVLEKAGFERLEGQSTSNRDHFEYSFA